MSYFDSSLLREKAKQLVPVICRDGSQKDAIWYGRGINPIVLIDENGVLRTNADGQFLGPDQISPFDILDYA